MPDADVELGRQGSAKENHGRDSEEPHFPAFAEPDATGKGKQHEKEQEAECGFNYQGRREVVPAAFRIELSQEKHNPSLASQNGDVGNTVKICLGQKVIPLSKGDQVRLR